jgi:hypothetical protein
VHSFGVEDVDRHVVVWRKEFAPCEDELEAIKQGIEYDPVVSAREKYEASKRQKQEEEEEKKRAKGEKKFVPRTNYKAKVYIYSKPSMRVLQEAPILKDLKDLYPYWVILEVPVKK